MLQRIQTVLLALAALLLGSMWLSPLLVLNGNSFPQGLAIGLSGALDVATNAKVPLQFSFWSGLLNITLIIGLIIIIMMYKNRVRQVYLSRVLQFLILGLAAITLYLPEMELHEVFTDKFTLQYHWPVFMPTISFLMVMLAIRFIRKDEEKVRAADRLR